MTVTQLLFIKCLLVTTHFIRTFDSSEIYQSFQVDKYFTL